MNGVRQGQWRIGPRVVVVTLGVYIGLVILVWLEPWLRFSAQRPLAVTGLAWLLIIAAVVVSFLVVRRVRIAAAMGYLDTDGVFAYVRHPIYAAFIFVECPGLALALWAWPGLALPLVAYGLYRLWVPVEEEELWQRFGSQYGAYCRQVRGVVPIRRHVKEPPRGQAGRSGPRRHARRVVPRSGEAKPGAVVSLDDARKARRGEGRQ